MEKELCQGEEDGKLKKKNPQNNSASPGYIF